MRFVLLVVVTLLAVTLGAHPASACIGKGMPSPCAIKVTE